MHNYCTPHIIKENFESFRFLWPCIVSKLWSERENQQDATVRCLLSIFSQHVSVIIMPIFRRTRRITACGVLRWFCWMWLVEVVGRCIVGANTVKVTGCWFSFSLHKTLRISWSIGATTYSHLKRIVYDKLLKPRQSFGITAYFKHHKK